MVIVEARKLSLPNPSSFSSSHAPPPQITSFLFDPTSKSIALHHSDSSFSLYPSLSPLSLSLPPPLASVPSPTSSATFLHLHYTHSTQPNNRDPDSVFLTSSPFLGGTAVLLRFSIFNSVRKSFLKLRVVSNHRDLRFDENKFGVVFGVSHGVSVKLVGGSNVFALYSASNSKIWVFAVKMLDEFRAVKLMKCAVIDCSLPVFSMNVSFGYLILGEENGVRVFRLRPLVKGRVKKERRVDGRRNVPSEDQWEGKNEKHSDNVKLRTVKLRQDNKEGASVFLAFNIKEVESFKSVQLPVRSDKAISIQEVSPNKFLILDSAGALHLLHIQNSIHGSEFSCNMELLTQTMKVRKLAVLPGAQTIWISDGNHTVHMLVVAEAYTSTNETDGKDSEPLLTQTSVVQAIFSSEKIQEIMPLAVDAILVLGQGSIFAYGIS